MARRTMKKTMCGLSPWFGGTDTPEPAAARSRRSDSIGPQLPAQSELRPRSAAAAAASLMQPAFGFFHRARRIGGRGGRPRAHPAL